MEKSNRLNGLDTLRASAITLVFMYHYAAFVSGEPTFGFASVIGWVGVDLFFVLSGYLIANQLLSRIAKGRNVSLKVLSHKAVALVVNTQLARWALPPGGKPPVIACACVTVGWLLFRLIEAPIMALRDRITDPLEDRRWSPKTFW